MTYSGAGVIYSMDKEAGDAYIITNYHVVYEAGSVGDETIPHISDDIRVYLYGQTYLDQYIQAEYVGGAMDYDIAVIRIEGSERLKNSEARVCEMGDSDQISVGETVYAIGNPDSQGVSVTRGVVSVGYEYIDILAADNERTLNLLEIRVDAAINHGNSGRRSLQHRRLPSRHRQCPFRGVGHPRFRLCHPRQPRGQRGADILDNAKSNNSKGAYRATLGVTVQVDARTSIYDEDTGSSYVVEKISVQEVTEGTPAEGQLAAGDIITGIRIEDGMEKEVTQMHTVTTFMFNVRKGDTVVITYERSGVEAEARITYDKDEMFTLFA